MRTYVYVDGFNLYYGLLKGTHYKWLDVETFVKKILRPHYQLLAIKYFTAKLKPRHNDPDVHIRQDTYLRALKKHIPKLTIYEGHFTSHKSYMSLADKPDQTVRVIRFEEKGSDVNLAAHLINDAWKNEYDCAVIISNDSDFSQALRIIKEDCKKRVILITPIKKNWYPAEKLVQYADFAYTKITNKKLADSQLPNPIPGTSIYKPNSWP